MKKLKSLICIILAATIMLPGCFATSAADPQVQKINFAVLGDSIASGYGLKQTLDCYAALIAKENSYHLTNDAVPGHTTENLLWVICQSENAKNSIRNADVISISISGNDFLNMIGKADTSTLLDIMLNGANAKVAVELKEKLEYNLNAVCTELRLLNEDAPIIFQTQYNSLYAHKDYSAYASLAEKFVPILNGTLESLTDKFRGIFIADVYSAFDNYYKTTGNYDIIQADGIHPSESGHRLIAQVILEKITQLEDMGLIPKAASLYYLLGDADGNGRISVADATIIQKILAGFLSFAGDIATLCLDADENGDVNIKDATSIQKHLVELEANPNIGNYLPFYDY